MIMKLLGKQGNNRQGEYFLLGPSSRSQSIPVLDVLVFPGLVSRQSLP